MEKKVIKSLWDLELPSAAKASNRTANKLEDSKIKAPVIAEGEKTNTSTSVQSKAPSQKPPAIQRIVGTEDKDSHIAKEMSRLHELARTLNQREAKLALDQKELSSERDRFKAEKLSLQSSLNLLVVNLRDCTEKEKANYKRASVLDTREANLTAGEQGLLAREARINQREIDLENLMAEAMRPEIEFKDLQTTLKNTKNELEFEKESHVQSQRQIERLDGKLALAHSHLDDQKRRFREQNVILAEVQRERDHLKRLESENVSLRLAIKNAVAESLELSRKISALQTTSNERTKVTLPSPASGSGPISPFSVNSMAVLGWLSSEVLEAFEPPEKIVTLGSGPFPEADFDDYLRTLGITPYESGHHWIVVGRSGWTPQKLDALIAATDLSEVRIFSQELFIAGVLTTHDPFSADPELLMEFSKGHPALEYLTQCGFEWPLLEELEELGLPQYVRGSYERVDESPIYRMGYVVGITNGLSVHHRQILLRKAFENKIPQVEDDDYMAEWGTPNTRKRLWRIAHHIAWLIRARRSNPAMSYAVSDWAKDLDWLEKTYYKESMRFSWPNS